MSRRLTPIRLALLKNERSQKWLAETIGKDEPTVSRIVNGLVPDVETREAIAQALPGSTVEDLFPAHGAEVNPDTGSADTSVGGLKDAA